jgi:hypothetical protein
MYFFGLSAKNIFRGENGMNIIPCVLGCIHQKEGYCCLDEAAAVTNCGGGCAYFVQKNDGQAKDRSVVNNTSE